MISSLLLFSCSRGEGSEEALQEATKLQDATMKAELDMEDKLKALSSSITVLPDSLKSVPLDSLEAIQADYTEWQSTLVTIPGEEHDHHDHSGHDHDHDHAPADDLTPEMMLEIQKELNKQASQLTGRIMNLEQMVKAE
ncbi:MAG: hypothetical protein AAF789_15305 [Bacteroidota bacterium]